MRASAPMLRLCLCLSLASSIARADESPTIDDQKPVAPTPPAPEPNDEIQWSAAPRPDQASGVARPDAKTVGDRMRWLPRALLFVPKWAVWGVGQPIRGAAYAVEQYDVVGRAQNLAFNEERTIGAYPVAAYETGFGFTVGARFMHKDLFGERERVKVRFDIGGRFRQAYGINLRSGRRFGDRVALEIDSSYERRPFERFYGIGNGDTLPAPPPMPIDPSVDDAAFATRFREDVIRNVLTLDAKVSGPFRSRLSGALVLRDFSGTGEADSIDMAYQTDKLVGFTSGVNNLYVEEELVYDSRRPASPYQSLALDGAGWLASAHVGVAKGIDGDRTEFVAYGGEVQHFFDLYDGSRILTLRMLVEAVGGVDTRAGDIAFIDLPRLGGSDYLRGYPNGRFRDRAITLGTAEYTWALGNFLAAYTFVDVGQAWGSLLDVHDVESSSLRVGFGGGVQLHTDAAFLTRAQIAGSRDGDVFLELALSPAFGRRERAGRF